MNEEYPPRLTITPEGTAQLFLMTNCPNAGIESRDSLVELFRLYYERGAEDAIKRSASKIEEKYKTYIQPWRTASKDIVEELRKELGE